MKKERRLAYVPIVHTQLDMGSVAPDLHRAYEDRHGSAGWTEHERAVADFWRGLEKKVDDVATEPAGIRLYQDGLPVCGREKEIIAEMAGRGSPNYRILQRLLDRGARVEGTEDPRCLVEEVRLIKEAFSILDLDERRRFTERTARRREELLRRRDRFIAERIAETLAEGELGLLFVGLVHDVAAFLPRDVRVEYVIYRLPFRRDGGRNGPPADS